MGRDGDRANAQVTRQIQSFAKMRPGVIYVTSSWEPELDGLENCPVSAIDIWLPRDIAVDYHTMTETYDPDALNGAGGYRAPSAARPFPCIPLFFIWVIQNEKGRRAVCRSMMPRPSARYRAPTPNLEENRPAINVKVNGVSMQAAVVWLLEAQK